MSTDIVSEITIPENPRIFCIATRGRECWLLQFRCVWCGKLHQHGGGPLDDGPDAGHRASHCNDPWSPDGYTLAVARVVS